MKIALKRTVSKDEGSDQPLQEPVPKGKYRVVITGAEEADDKWGGISLDAKIQAGEYAGRELTRLRVFPGGKYGPNEALKSLVETLGGDADDENFDFDLDELNGTELNVYLETKPGKKGGSFNNIKRFTPAPTKKTEGA